MDEELFLSSYDDSQWSFPVLINIDDDQNNMGLNNNNNNIVEHGEKMEVINVVEAPESALATATKTGGGGTERERRRKMKELYANLHGLMPHLPSTADRCTMVVEAASYIKKLQETLLHLQKKKAENTKAPMIRSSAFLGSQLSSMAAIDNNNRAVALANPSNLSLLSPSEIKPTTFKTWSCSNVVLNVFGKDAHIYVVCGKKKPGFLTGICWLLEKYMIEVVMAEVSSDGFRKVCMIRARANVGFPIVSAEALNVVEEMHKRAAQDIIMWLNSI